MKYKTMKPMTAEDLRAQLDKGGKPYTCPWIREDIDKAKVDSDNG